jgi:hypothetical protein
MTPQQFEAEVAPLWLLLTLQEGGGGAKPNQSELEHAFTTTNTTTTTITITTTAATTTRVKETWSLRQMSTRFQFYNLSRLPESKRQAGSHQAASLHL